MSTLLYATDTINIVPICCNKKILRMFFVKVVHIESLSPMSVGIMSCRAGLKSVGPNGVRQGGILSPYLFCVYADELTRTLNNVNAGCFVGASLVNHLMYADYLVLLAPSAAGLSLLLYACSYYGIEFDVKYNSTKSNVMVFCCNLLKDIPVPS